MLKKRIIFTLLYFEGFFCLSRNFRLQKVGDIDWLLNKFHFENLSGSIDELIVINISANPILDSNFLDSLERILKYFFIPVTIGGNIRSLDSASQLFNIGADKIAINTLFHLEPQVCLDVINRFGSQAVVASVDVRVILDTDSSISNCYTYYSRGLIKSFSIEEHFSSIQEFGCGEILLRSIDRDGTGNGLDMRIIDFIKEVPKVPLVFAGGIGKPSNILEGILNEKVDAVATANLLNFVGNGLFEARKYVSELHGNITNFD